MKNTAKNQAAISKSAEPTMQFRERHHYEMVEAPPKFIGELEIAVRRPYKKLTKILEQLYTDGVWREVPIVKSGCFSKDP